MDPMDLINQLTALLNQRQSLASVLGQGSAQDIGRQALKQAQEAVERIRADLDRTRAEMEERLKPAPPPPKRSVPPTPPPPAPSAPPATPQAQEPAAPEPEPFPEGILRYVPATQAREVCQAYSLSLPASALLGSGEQLPRRFVDRLRERGLYADIVQFLVHGLIKQVAILYGGVCIRQATPLDQLPAAQVDALAAAMRYVMKPEEALSRAVEPAVKAAGSGTACGCLAMAVRATAPSLSQPDLPVVPPPPAMTARFIWSAVSNAIAKVPPERHDDFLAELAVIGVWMAVHGPLARPGRTSGARTNVRDLVRHLFEELKLIERPVDTADHCQEIWEHLHEGGRMGE